jgi:bifunctional UDP-N-acetylglucosamine pyrophosphorylase/glucosamine-1-phosphate N-acetyltransferase
VWIDHGVEHAEDVVLEPGVRLRGKTRVGRGTLLDVGCVLENCVIGENVHVKAYTVASASTIEHAAQLGPFSHLRPDSHIEEHAHIGNFVETKKTRVRKGAKANHLAYLGDADIGEKANIGAGTIVCNYDGFSKHRTSIGAGAFIGSDSQLVAPVTIGTGAYVATGTTVTRDVPDDALAIGRARQENKPGYASRLRANLSRAHENAKKSGG